MFLLLILLYSGQRMCLPLENLPGFLFFFSLFQIVLALFSLFFLFDFFFFFLTGMGGSNTVVVMKERRVADFAYLTLQNCFKVVQVKVIFLMRRLLPDYVNSCKQTWL